MTQPGAELEQQLAYLAEHLLGWRPCVEDGEDCWAINGWVLRDRKVRRDNFPRLLTGNGMLEIIEAMQERGYDCEIDIQSANYQFAAGAWVKFTDTELSSTTKRDLDADRLTECVARAAYSALTAKDS